VPDGLASRGTTLYVANEDEQVEGFTQVTNFTTPNSSWTSYGGTAFIDIFSVAINPSNNDVYVLDNGANKVYQLTSAGGAVNASAYAFSDLEDLATDSSGNYYVADNGLNEVFEFSSAQAEQNHWTEAGINTLTNPTAVALDSSNNIYIADSGNLAIYKLSSSTGNALLYTWTLSASADITQMAIDGSGNIYAADIGNVTVDKFIPGTAAVASKFIGSEGGGAAFLDPIGITILPTGNLLVADDLLGKLQEYVP
jgi:sugar lactone lactonase YvrE